MGCGLVQQSAGPGPRASLSAAVARNGPQAGPAEDAPAHQKQAALPSVGVLSAYGSCSAIDTGNIAHAGGPG